MAKRVRTPKTHAQVMKLLGAGSEDAERVRDLLEEGEVRSHLPAPMRRHLEGVAARNPKEVVAPLWTKLIVASEVDGEVVELHGTAAIEDIAAGVEGLHMMLEHVSLEVRAVTIKRNGWVTAECHFTGQVRRKKDRKFLRLIESFGWRPGEHQGVKRTLVCHVVGDWIMRLGEEGVIVRGLQAVGRRVVH